MVEDERTRREITWYVGGTSEPPFEGEASESVRWMQAEGCDVMPEPYGDVRFRFELREGTWVCTGLYLTCEELSARELSERFPFAQLREHAVEGLALMTKTEPPRVTAPRRRGRQGNSDEFLSQIAALYRYALEHPVHRRAPVAFIRTQEDLWRQGHEPAEDTVRAWVRQARKRGFLGASIQGKAGEQPQGSE